MSFGGGGGFHTEEPRVLSLRVNQSAYGGAKTRVWGKFRVPGNLLDYMDFTAIPHTTTQSAGGKGGGSIESTYTTYTYTAATVIGLAVGEVAGIGKVWQDKDVVDLALLGLALKTGALRPAPWSHLTANHPDKAVSYSGIAYVCNNAFDLGSSASSPNLSFEVFGARILAGADDADPAAVIADIVTDPLEGAGLSSAVLSNVDDYALWCAAMGLSVSVGATAQISGRDLIAQILKATLAEAIWSAGQIKIVPYGDEPVGDWSPNTTPVYDLTEADFLEPPRHKRTQPADAVNRVTLNYVSRAKDYNTVTITRDDLAAVTQFGPRPESLDLPCITRDEPATVVCEFWRDRGLYIRNRWECVVDERFCLIEAMDLLTISFDPQYLDQVAVRVVEVEDAGDGRITLLVEEWPFGLLKPTAIPTQTVSGYVPEQNVAPGATNTPVVFEAPNALTAPNLEIWIGASGGEHWGGARVWVSDIGDSYQQVGTITNPARHGVLVNSLAAGSDPDTAHTLYLDMAPSHGQLLGGTQADADNGNTLCWLDGEMISYQTATLTDVDRYQLSYLRRGQKGTVSAGHSAGGQFLRIDDAVFKYAVPRERIGSAVWIKLQSINKFGRSPEPLDTVSAFQYTIAGNKPLPLDSLAATGGMFQIAVTWALNPAAVGVDYVEIWGSTTNDRAAAFQLTSQKRGATNWKHPGLQPGQSWYYWGRTVDTSGNASDFTPTGATGGVYASPSADPSALLVQLKNSVGLDQLLAEVAQPINAVFPIAAEQAAATLQGALDSYEMDLRLQWQEQVTSATITVNTETGEIELLGAAAVTTDVENRLTAVEVDLDAAGQSLTSTVATLSTVEGNLSSAQSQIAQLQNQITETVSQVYVDAEIANATGAITVTAANAYGDLAEQAIQSALDQWSTDQSAAAMAASVAVAQESLTATADALGAEVVNRQLLAASVAANSAAITAEQAARADADAAEATARTALAARVTTAEGGISANAASITAEASARADADSALSSSISTVAATAAARNRTYRQTSSPASGMVSGDVWFDSDDNNKAYRYDGSAWVATDDARIATNSASITAEASARADADSANAASISTLTARLDTGDYAAVKEQASVTADEVAGVKAQYLLQVDVNGHVSAIALESGADGGALVFLADKLLFAMPDGSGTPRQVVIVGNVGGVPTLGLDGNQIVDGTIVARALAAGTITAESAVIADAAITAAKIGNTAVTSAKIADAAITSAKIASAAITAAKIADAAITSAKIGNAEVDTLHLAGNAVTIPLSAQGVSVATTSTYTFDGYTSVVIVATAIASDGQDQWSMRIERNGVSIYSSGNIGGVGSSAFMTAGVTIIDLPPAGASYYTAKIVSASDHRSVGLVVIGTKR